MVHWLYQIWPNCLIAFYTSLYEDDLKKFLKPLSSLTSTQVVPHLYDVLSSLDLFVCLKNVWNKQLTAAIGFHSIFLHAMWNCLVTHILQNFFYAQQKKEDWDSSPKNEMFVIIYSLSRQSKPLCISFFCESKKKVGNQTGMAPFDFQSIFVHTISSMEVNGNWNIGNYSSKYLLFTLEIALL